MTGVVEDIAPASVRQLTIPSGEVLVRFIMLGRCLYGCLHLYSTYDSARHEPRRIAHVAMYVAMGARSIAALYPRLVGLLQRSVPPCWALSLRHQLSAAKHQLLLGVHVAHRGKAPAEKNFGFSGTTRAMLTFCSLCDPPLRGCVC